MTTVTNNTPNPIVLPNAVQPIPVGATVEIENWAEIAEHWFVKKLLDAKHLLTGAEVAEAPVSDDPDQSPAAQLEALNAAQAGEPEPAKRGRKAKADPASAEEANPVEPAPSADANPPVQE